VGEGPLNTAPRSPRWVDRLLSWGVLATVVAVALIGLALLTTARHPTPTHSATGGTVLMAQPIDSALPTVQLGRRPTGTDPCAQPAATNAARCPGAPTPARAPSH